ncbi:MAG TPA: NAD-dependent epimerase/dehydratase family protein [Verrucomicrobiae bacterium]|nr:NAD-dependent epimerase/dehydratase family protein [Verrucomicrobiae bacterium]
MTAAARRIAGPILVTGGAGFIGSHVVEALLAEGREVRVLDDLSTGRQSNLPLHDPNLELVAGDITDAAIVVEAMRGASACIHLAAQPGPRAGGDSCDVAMVNLLGFINVLEAARQCHVARIAFASSAAVYGEAEGATFSETTPPRPVTPAGMEALLAEGYAELYRRQHGLRPLGLRYFPVYGPRQHVRGGIVPDLLQRLDARRPILLRGDGHQQQDFIHVEDAAHATLAALDSAECGVLNVGSGRATSLRELVSAVGFALDVKPMMHFAPAAASNVATGVADTTALRRVTGLSPARSLRSGLAMMASDRLARRRRSTTTLRVPLMRPEPAARRAF